MKKILSFFFSLSLGVVLLIWVIRFLGWEEIKSAFLIFTGWHGMIILFLTFLMLFFGMWKWQVILKNQGHKLSHRELLGPYLAGFSLVYLFPMIVLGGEIFRGYILKEKHAVTRQKAIASILIDKILELTSFLIAIIVGLFFFFFKTGLPSRNLGIIFGVVILFLVLAAAFFYFKIFKRESIARFFNKFLIKKFPNQESLIEIENEVFHFFKFKKKGLWQASALAFLRVAVTWLRCWVLILFLGKNVGIFSALSVLGFYYFVLMIPIPTALGSHEIIQTFSFQALGIGASIAPAFTMIQRAAELILAFIGLAIFMKLGMRLLRVALFRKVEGLMNKGRFFDTIR
ncbi:MAG: hypothetical protein COT59_01055 [Candidatus Nealsonbacteria bacterium CG09_land_8_20_14_0_10_42_14]|uniref:Flippase-like domain-containing protein n=1 Tax=Candidatus Nealsonbacteria bacterium CG09_land_8_20_14_0_10_42_14 TaxID=1974707 RepID=A0A2H0WXF9_9BACT|nr:MAG: hypothetical protein COT59_01055 [Candidatus Nealsonbacteria bacterium CG09_land_8_20_14_0_10_42_14]